MNKTLVNGIDNILKKEGHLVDWSYKHFGKNDINYAHYENERKALATQIANSLRSNDVKITSIMADLVEEYFTKGKCKERGKAIMLIAQIKIALSINLSNIIEVKE